VPDLDHDLPAVGVELRLQLLRDGAEQRLDAQITILTSLDVSGSMAGVGGLHDPLRVLQHPVQLQSGHAELLGFLGRSRSSSRVSSVSVGTEDGGGVTGRTGMPARKVRHSAHESPINSMAGVPSMWRTWRAMQRRPPEGPATWASSSSVEYLRLAGRPSRVTLADARVRGSFEVLV
jgi:hypothetical protein